MCSWPTERPGKLQSGCFSRVTLQKVCRSLTVLLPTHTSCPHSTASDLTPSRTHHSMPGRDDAPAQAGHKTGHRQVHLGQVCTQHIKRSAAKPSRLEDVPRHNAGTWAGTAPRPQAHRGTRWAGTVGSPHTLTHSGTTSPHSSLSPHRGSTKPGCSPALLSRPAQQPCPSS